MSKSTNERCPGGDIAEAFILRLPNEILSDILDLSADVFCSVGGFWIEDEFSTITAALPKVCKRFNRIATPKLYHGLVIKWGKMDKSTRLLHFTLKQNPELRQYCKRLTIISNDESAADSSSQHPSSAMDLISWLTGTAQLKIVGRERMAEIALSTVHALGDLGSHNANVAMLDLSYIAKPSHASQWQSLQGSEGTAPFTALRLHRYTQTPEELELVLRWPAKLEELFFRPLCAWSTGQSGFFEHWNFSTLQPILDIHKSTLRKISIPELDQGDITNLNLSDYPSLEILELPATLTGTDVTNIPRLVAPRLRVFMWRVVTWNSELEEQLEDFDQPEEDWLRAFVAVAVERKRKLREIFVEFSPMLLGALMPESRYPWDRMAEIARDVDQYGVKIRHSPPTISSDEFVRARRL